MMENAYVWAHEICGELQISKISWGSQKWAEFLNEIVLGFSKFIGTARFREKKSDFASVLLYTFSGLRPLRDGLIFRVPIGRCVPPSGRSCEQLTGQTMRWDRITHDEVFSDSQRLKDVYTDLNADMWWILTVKTTGECSNKTRISGSWNGN